MSISNRRNINLFHVGLVCLNLLVVLSVFGSNPAKIKIKQTDSLKVKNAEKSIDSSTDLSDYNYHQNSYYTDFDLKQVWCRYISINPYLLWSGPINHLKLLYNDNRSYNVHRITENTAILLELHFLKKIKVDALFLVTEIDPQKHLIEFCYADNNVTSGLQRIEFKSYKNGTVIEHSTYYKSKKTFRDKVLYPHFHGKCIDEFHDRILTSLLRKEIQESDEFQEMMVYQELEN